MKRAIVIGKKVLHAALLITSALLMLLIVMDEIPKDTPLTYTAMAPSLEIMPLPPLHPLWLLNSGDLRDLEELPGIGEVIAARIIENREIDGLFYFPEDVMEVKGIGTKTMQAILEWLREHPEKAYIFPE